MAQMVVTANADEKEAVWHIDASNGQATAQIWPTRNLIIEWADGTIQVLPKRLRCLTNPGFATSVDITTLDYYVVTYRGSTDPANIVPVSALATLDSLFAGHDWGLLRVFGRWGSRDPLVAGGTGLPVGADGDLLYFDPATHQWTAVAGTQGDTWRYENGIWEHLPIGDVDDLYHVEAGPHGKRPVWVAAASIITPFIPPTIITNSVLLGSERWTSTGASLPDHWTDLNYDDSGSPWVNGVLSGTPGDPAVSWGALVINQDGVHTQSTTDADVTRPADWVLAMRRRFTINDFTPTSAVLWMYPDSFIGGVWINGHGPIYAAPTTNRDALQNCSIDVSLLLLLGQTNVLAIQTNNASGGASTNPTRLAYGIALR